MSKTTPEQSPSSATSFEPKIVAFVCKWCTYAGADLAGTSRMTYPSNVRTIMLPCTGRIDVSFVLRAFLQGADGVIVSGCHPGDCHYTAGNFRARRRWILFRDLLDTLGFDLRRFDLAWISAAEGAKWVKTIDRFTQKIRDLGPYEAMHKVAGTRSSPVAPSALAAVQKKCESVQPVNADPQLIAAAQDALQAGRIKALVGWVKSWTLLKARPVWITDAAEAGDLVQPTDDLNNLARFVKNNSLKSMTPLGIVVRGCEMRAMNVLLQEAQIESDKVVFFAIDSAGKFLGEMNWETASEKLVGDPLKALDEEQPAGFSPQVFKSLDELMAKAPEQRWSYWAEQSAKCVKCYACRNSCPMCSCDQQCFAEKNQPQWFPTAADGPGNLAWHVMRAFHMSGRCVGCGACEAACPAGVPLTLLAASMARSALKHFDHRAGADAKSAPLQSDYQPNDQESFIL